MPVGDRRIGGGRSLGESDEVSRHYAGAVQDFGQVYSPVYEGYPAEQKRLELIQSALTRLDASTVLDCGCGEGTPMSSLHDTGLDVWGFDFVDAMVDATREKLESRRIGHRVWQGDISAPSAFTPVGVTSPHTYDATIAMGVFPHLDDEVKALSNMANATSDGGAVFVEFRNELFSLFTLNNYSHAFVRDELIRAEEAGSAHTEYRDQLGELLQQLERFYRMDLPPQRTGSPETPGYDEILSKFHNPLTVERLFHEAGLAVQQTYYYHYHALPPMFERAYPELFRRLSLDMEEDPTDWRGNFMASAFVVEAVKATG
jgi:SAM-dependent methyltransferase